MFRLKPKKFRGRTVFKVIANRRRAVRSVAREEAREHFHRDLTVFKPALRRAMITAQQKHAK